MPELTIRGVRLHVEDSGGALPAVCFSHGLLMSTRMFDAQVHALRHRYRCVAWDHRGQGASSVPPGRSIDIETVYEDAVALIEQLGLAPVHFVGLSMGGFVGLRLAARRPELVRSLVLLETSAEEEPPQNVPKYRALNLVARTLGVSVVADRVTPILFGRTFLTDPRRENDRDYWRSLLMRNRRSIYKAVNGVIERRPVVDELSRIRCPTLVMVGEEDVATVPAKAERLQQGIAGARLVRIPGAGHSSTVEQPDLVTRQLEEFLGAQGV